MIRLEWVMKNTFFELCADSLEAARAAESGGADGIELCSGLSHGGVTPGADLLAADLRSFAIPVHVLIRPRAGSFVFSTDEYELMRQQIAQAKEAGASGVAVGLLLPDGRVDVERTRALVELARPMAVTIHRAFDETPDLAEALENAIQTGADHVLTSGGAADVLLGAEFIATLRRQAGQRIAIVAGGGLRLASLVQVVRRSGVYSLHGSLTHENGSANHGTRRQALEAAVRRAVELLESEYQESAAPVRRIFTV
jgi:copper homeostasis protein